MINNSFDKSKPLFTPKEVYDSHNIKPIEKKTDKCIVTYAVSLKEEILKKYKHEVVAYSGTANGMIEIYYLNDLNTLFYMSPVCAPACVATLEEVSYITGVKNFIFFGSCGLLIDEAKDKVIIPKKAYRDEGTSYHYIEASDFIDIKTYKFVEEVCKKNNIDYIIGYTWTTDGLYRETIDKIEDRRKKGCICVEMETSALEAMADCNNLNLFVFLYSGDILTTNWSRADLGMPNENKKQLNGFDVALLIAREIK